MATKNLTTAKSLGRQLNFTTGRMNALCQKVLDPYGISLPQWVILSCLWREGKLTVGALSERIGTRLPATSRIVDRMDERGLIVRRPDKSDGRVTMVDVTGKGRELDHLANFHETINTSLLAGFSEQESELIFDLLCRVEQNATEALEQNDPDDER